MVIKNWLSKVKFFWCQGIFFVDFYLKNGGKMNLRIITKNHPADSKIGPPLKIDFRTDWTHESIPTALELTSHKYRKNNHKIPLRYIRNSEISKILKKILQTWINKIYLRHEIKFHKTWKTLGGRVQLFLIII